MPKAKRPPTDYELLSAIYREHRGDFARTDDTRVLVPIDIPAIADDLGVDLNSVFGRLYHHLDPLYGQEKDSKGTRKAFFTPVAGDKENCISFPILEAVLASLWQQRRRDLWTLWIAFASIGIAVGSLVVSIVAVASA